MSKKLEYLLKSINQEFGSAILYIKDSHPYKLIKKIEGLGSNVQDFDLATNFNQLFSDPEFDENDNDLICFVDIHSYFDKTSKDAKFISNLKKWISRRDENKKPVLIIASEVIIPDELKSFVTLIEAPALNEDEVILLITTFCKDENITQPDPVTLEKMGKYASGMEDSDIEHVLRRIKKQKLDINKNATAFFLEKKKELINQSGFLELIEPQFKFEDLGGFENVKKQLRNDKKTFSIIDKHREANINLPQGFLVAGMPGCGKSMTATIAADYLGYPLVRFDIGKIMGKYVGESEKNLDTVLEVLKKNTPVVLWIDEMEKAFAGVSGDGNDVSKRLLGKILTWMNDKGTSSEITYIVATSNNLSTMPAELLRSGRFDNLFFVDFPTSNERKEILNNLLKKEKLNHEIINKLTQETDGFSGSDLKSLVNNSFKQKINNGLKELTIDVLRSNKGQSTKEQQHGKIQELKDSWKEYNFKNASEVYDVTLDLAQNFEYHKKYAEQGLQEAQEKLGGAYSFGIGTEENLEEAVRWFKKAAEQGNFLAQFNLGLAYDMGDGVIEDEEEAVRWYKKSADQNYAQAQYYLGLCYDMGDGVKEDKEEAFRWFTKAADQDYAAAQNNLGYCFSFGVGVKVDLEEGLRWYKIAADQDFAEAQNSLGKCFYYGVGVKVDLEESVFWFKKAADQEDADAQFNLGAAYELGKGVEKDTEKAFLWYKKAAEQGYAAAQFNLGLAYDLGKGVKENKEEAFRWFEKSAEQDYTNAKFAVAKAYDSGDGVKKNKGEAFRWFEKLAEQGYATAQYYLGLAYDSGEGVPENAGEAFYWFKKAADQAHDEAQFYVGVSYEYGKGVKKNIAKAVEWYAEAAELGHVQSQFILGISYEHGEGIKEDKLKARFWYEEAANQGFEPAIEALKKLKY